MEKINILKEDYLLFQNNSNAHFQLSNYVANNIDYYYYKPLSSKNKKDINELLNHYQNFIFKPHFINYLQFYNLFSLAYYWSKSNTFMTNIFLHSFYICFLTEDILSKKFKYNIIYDKNILKNISLFLLHYIIFFKLKLNENSNYSYLSKTLYYGSITTFQTLMNFNYAYKKRLNNLLNTSKNNNLFEHEEDILPFHLLVLTSDISLIKDIVNYTQYFHFSNYLFFISLFIILF